MDRPVEEPAIVALWHEEGLSCLLVGTEILRQQFGGSMLRVGSGSGKTRVSIGGGGEKVFRD